MDLWAADRILNASQDGEKRLAAAVLNDSLHHYASHTLRQGEMTFLEWLASPPCRFWCELAGIEWLDFKRWISQTAFSRLVA